MELIYFISGIITVLAIYSAVYLRSVRSKYNDLLASLQSSSNISSIRYEEFRQDFQDVNVLVNDIQAKMEKDQYESVSEMNKKVDDLNIALVGYQQRNNQFVKVTEGDIKKIYNEIQNTQGMIRALKEDPNFNNRY